jgi:pimeloyl-ACP methyl ester carboxylesterase
MNRYFLILMLLVIICTTPDSSATAQTTTKKDSTKIARDQTPILEEAVKVETPTGNLYGTLLFPQTKRKVPVVLIISGSGPTDRNGNSPVFKGPNNSLKLLAEGLAAHGIASLRYDKRGIGETGKEMLLDAQKANKLPNEADLRFDAYIDDAVLWGRKLRNDKRFSSVTIAGHSEGSLIGIVAARRIRADRFVSIAGAGRPAQQILLEQLKLQLTPELLKQTEEILNQLAVGQTVASVPSALNALFRPSIQPYMISWLRYDPTKEIAVLTAPALIVQGTTDAQVSVDDAKRLATAKSTAKLLIIEGMNHVLKQVSGYGQKQVASYSDPTLPVVPLCIDEISRFVNNATK